MGSSQLNTTLLFQWIGLHVYATFLGTKTLHGRLQIFIDSISPIVYTPSLYKNYDKHQQQYILYSVGLCGCI